ncbi:hypothetical protein KIN20_022987 [Parelaphostrongylus tenuis]|uniref:Peroxisomal membrane protein PEX14 n=1 Tax=Parelaphostrongylus tenuis TaxID=148309 RepID=A0AAD5MRA6_PARTN|nr:hypothetical protein KIN20_022987 [Parelaphostrongylus tenuis]
MDNEAAPQNRPEMVEAAKKFMLTPKVRDTAFEEQRLFLLGKGVTESEIAEAKSQISQNPGIYSASAIHYDDQMNARSSSSRIMSIVQTASIFGCVSYAGYRFLRSYILPRFFDIPDPATEEVRQLQVNELQNSIKFVLDSISQTTSVLLSQQQEVSRALLTVGQRDSDISRVEAGISTIKSLLLSHNNFAPILAPTTRTTELPSWQQERSAESSSTLTASSGYSAPPANGVEAIEELCNDKEIAKIRS